MVLVIDNFDSFTLNLAEYLHKLGKQTIVLRNTVPISELAHLDIEGIILSPGPQLPKDSNNLMAIINHYEGKVPLLGVCLGHQAINQHFSGTLKKLEHPVHGKVSTIEHSKEGLFNNVPSPCNVVRYHSWTIDKLGKDLDIKGRSIKDDSIMAIAHNNHFTYGIQFHPESILTDFGIDIIKNWLIASGIS